ncbi:MAG: GTP diphosphokinase [Acidiferrobacterales bacterium]|nr:GTP diphosphokinase [Acidiferrobacterales bacterium]
MLDRAYRFAHRAHAGQQRASGEPYITHSLEVARILADLRLDHETIAAALLHDVVEDTALSVEIIAEHFGPGVAKLVDGVTKMDMIRGLPARGEVGKHERAHSESLRKMLLAMAEDVRVVLIKLADRLHNMRTLDSLAAEARRRIAQETLELFAPLANRLGIWQIKWELEDLAFRHLEPEAYEEIAQRLAERRDDREQYIAHFVGTLKNELGCAGIKAEVKGRAKHTYGIWRKMRRKSQDFHQIHDVRAVRVLVDTIPDCYAALGVVHTRWQFIPGEFDDYIATPKENNYRSIHTAVIGPDGKTVEVQIRTYEMQGEAELGVAAHWRYKEKARQDQDFDKKIVWLRQLLDWKDEVVEAGEFIDQFKSEVFADRIYVFTPKGNIVDLPQGATPLDFAYHIHTEVGHRCRGAKVNGQMVPLTYPLKTGEQVSILTVKKGGPSRDWLNQDLGCLKTSRARSKVQHWFRQQNLEESITAGRTSLERELSRLGLVDINHEKLTRKLGFNKVEELLAAVGRGETRTAAIVGALRDVIEPNAPEESLAPVQPLRIKETSAAIEIQGVGNLLTRMAKCCKPLPGDGIIGFITSGRGVTVHRRDCPNALRYGNSGDERLVEVNWGHQRGNTYPVDVEVMVYDRQGLLRDIGSILANEKINVMAITSLSDRKVSTGRIRLTLEIPDVATLSRVLTRIDRLPNVTAVRRMVH